MSWLAQVRHVLAKDLRHARWFLAAYAAAVAVASAHVLNWTQSTDAIYDVAMIAVVVLAVLIVAGWVQADPPRRATAHWVTLPLDPIAVLAAKLVLAAFLVLLPALGEIAVLRLMRLAPRTIVMLAGAAGVAFGAWLLAAMVLAALTRDLRGFVLLYVAIPFAVLLEGMFFRSAKATPWWTPTPAAMDAATVIALAAALALLAFVFRRRDVHPAVWAPALIVVLALMSVRLVDAAPEEVPPSGIQRIGLRIALDSEAPPGTLAVHVAADSLPATTRARVFIDSVAVALRSGRTLTVPGRGGSVRLDNNAESAGPPDRWIACRREGLSAVNVQLNLDAVEESALASEGAPRAVTFYGRVEISRAEVSASGPADVGQLDAGDGARVRVTAMAHDAGSAEVDLRILAASGGHSRANLSRDAYFDNGTEVDMVNTGRHERIALGQRSSQGGDMWLVLPGAVGTDYSSRFGCEERGPRAVALPGDDWFAHATLQVVQWRSGPEYAVQLSSTSAR